MHLFQILPSLQSFCIYAAVGVFLMYIFVITFVVAILTLDERRIRERRNSFIPCIIHTEKNTQKCCELNLMHRSLKLIYSKFILTKTGKVIFFFNTYSKCIYMKIVLFKIIVIMSVICLSGFSLESLFKLQQKFDPQWFIPERTYLHKYLVEQTKYYPDMGYEATIFMGKINYTEEMPKIILAIEQITNQTDLIYNLDSWIEPYQQFVSVFFGKSSL